MPAVAADQGASTNGADPQQSEQININTADVTALQQLDGVGEKKSRKKLLNIVKLRGSLNQLKISKRSVVLVKKTLERLKPHITV
ncbi:ComEA family DNA-binding protein [Secundilactobacillus odoratitofui]|uniref:ComEA family DNA-binding protein n=1 Tax=Secundilactobacillus odoratitofui TaxID=480930 RepID=UPI0006D16657|nr:helix-hairpin-helix domain-containing protein [Secundilactobacillus odoratitofui]